jgi:hypothetical protein
LPLILFSVFPLNLCLFILVPTGIFPIVSTAEKNYDRKWRLRNDASTTIRDARSTQ